MMLFVLVAELYNLPPLVRPLCQLLLIPSWMLMLGDGVNYPLVSE
ncbi:hypothetical protein TPER_HE00541 [Candidatus Hoaglandella endobia]|uniref:Uncharacterized protein n=1 Tax=Candidatus Hoaglandella endobia TaxID=1778263 RepID=A0A143WUN0_9ENTR|nr:hypothetical protein TPER_HE00541 [Candidatus Hoaglandella endobia]